MSSEKKYDDHGQRMTDCCGVLATYGTDVEALPFLEGFACGACGRLTTKGEGDSTEFRDGITYDIWFARVMLMKMVDSAEEF